MSADEGDRVSEVGDAAGATDRHALPAPEESKASFRLNLPIDGRPVVSSVGEALVQYLAAGRRPVPLHGTIGDACTCGDPACAHPGKHPRGPWKMLLKSSPSEDQVRSWSSKYRDLNVALVCSGGFAVLDLDDKEAASRVLTHPAFDDALIVETRRGYHVYLQERRPSRRAVAFAEHVDLLAEGGLVVVPPSRVGKHVYRIERDGAPIEVENAAEWLASLLGELGIPRLSKAASTRVETPTVTPGVAPSVIVSALAALEPGRRSDSFTRISGSLHRRGVPREDIIALLSPHAAAVDFNPRELRALVEGLCRRYPSAALSEEPRRFETQSVVELFAALDDPTKVSWNVEGLIASASGTSISGLPAGGKTWLVLALAIAVSRGDTWLSKFPCVKGTVLYIDEESRHVQLAKRLSQLLAGLDLTRGDCPNLHFAVMKGLNLSYAPSVECLRMTLEAERPALVIIDSLIRAHRADENSATEMARVGAVVQALMNDFKCSFVFTDHLRKSMKGGEASDPRGSVEKAAIQDQIMLVRRTKVGSDTLKVEVTKSRFDREPQPFEVRLWDPDPSRSMTRVEWVRDLEAGESRVRDAAAKVFALFVDKAELSRKEIVEVLRHAPEALPEKRVDEALADLVATKRVIREHRPGPAGGMAAYFRPVGAILSDE